MATKQLGKLRQWAGEVISSREKAQPSSEFIALEQDIEIRRIGIHHLNLASRDYLQYISLKQPSDAVVGKEPLMQSEALGVVMIEHGAELGDASALGRSLTLYGRARCQIAAIHDIYAVTFTDTFLAYLERSGAELDEYAAQRKKLESRRLAYDAALSKAEKTYKKEKDKKEVEEELEKAKARYEEMAEDVRSRMDIIREGEVEHQQELRKFLRSETHFVQQYLEVLKEVASEWPEQDTYADLRKPTSSLAALHNFSRVSTRSTDSKESDTKQAPPVPFRRGSRRSNRSVRSASSRKSGSGVSANQHESSSESEDDPPRSRASSRLSRKMSTRGSRPQSRQSKARSRSGSVTTVGNNTIEDVADDAASTKSGGKHKKAPSGVTSWVGDALTGVMSRNKSRNADTENFAALADNDESNEGKVNGTRTKHSRKLSNRSTKSNKSANGRNRSQDGGRESGKATKKVMKALYDFSGSNEELSFKAGDEINVLNMILDDWWQGEIDGRKGLFPVSYTTPIKIAVGTTTTKFKNSSNSSILALGRGSGKFSSEDEESRRTLVEPSESELSMTEDEQDGDSINGWHPFDDRHQSAGPESIPTVPPAGDQHHRVTDTPRQNGSVNNDHEFNRRLSLSLAKLDVQQTAYPPQSPGTLGSAVDATTSSPGASPAKRMPPPPPPRRQTGGAGSSGPPPPLPVRNPGITPSRTQSSNAALQALVPPLADRRAHSETSSPFESQSELSFETVAKTRTFADPKRSGDGCTACECEEYVEDPFRGRGLCARCTHAHK